MKWVLLAMAIITVALFAFGYYVDASLIPYLAGTVLGILLVVTAITYELVNDVCKHCGGTKPGPESTCIPRMWDGAPEPEWRVPSVESYRQNVTLGSVVPQ